MAPGEHRLDIWRLRSRDGRQTWPHPERIWTGYTGALNSVLQLNSGRILLPFSYAVTRTWSDRGTGPDAFTFMGTFLCTVIYSDDHGATWQLSNALKVQTPDITYAYGAVEPVAVELKDGRVWMLHPHPIGPILRELLRRRRRLVDAGTDGDRLPRIPPPDWRGWRTAGWRCCGTVACAIRMPTGGRQALHGAVSDDDGRSLAWISRGGARPVARRAAPAARRSRHGVSVSRGHCATAACFSPPARASGG